MLKLHHSVYRVVIATITMVTVCLCMLASSCTQEQPVEATITTLFREEPPAQTIEIPTESPSSFPITSSPLVIATTITKLPLTVTATKSPTATPISRRPPPTSIPTQISPLPPTPTPSSIHPILYPLVLNRYGDLHVYHSAETPAIQIRWLKETYDSVRISLKNTTGVSLDRATVYLLDEEQYVDILSEIVGIDQHPEWTQGVAYRRDSSSLGVVYINKAVSAIWGASTSEFEKNIWQGQNVESITRKVAAHELTHLALMPYEVPSWLNEGLAKYMENTVLPEDLILKEKLRLRYSLRDKALQSSLPSMSQLNAKNWIIGATNYPRLASLYELSTGIIWSAAEVPGFVSAYELVIQPPSDLALEVMVSSVLNGWLTIPMPEEESAVILCTVAKQWFESDKLMYAWNEIIERNSFDGWDHAGFLQELDAILEVVDSINPETQVESLRSEFFEYLKAFRKTVFYLLQGDNDLAESMRIKTNGHLETAYSLLQTSADSYLSTPCEGSIGTNYSRLSE
jgi:hypothetical protein